MPIQKERQSRVTFEETEKVNPNEILILTRRFYG